MEERAFNEERNVVVKYNNELWSRFVFYGERLVSKQLEPKRTEISQSLDLLRAINSFRSHPTPQDLFNDYPELERQRVYVEMLWEHFSQMDEFELSELMMEMIHDLEL